MIRWKKLTMDLSMTGHCGVMGKECLNRVAFKKMRSEQVWITSI